VPKIAAFKVLLSVRFAFQPSTCQEAQNDLETCINNVNCAEIFQFSYRTECQQVEAQIGSGCDLSCDSFASEPSCFLTQETQRCLTEPFQNFTGASCSEVETVLTEVQQCLESANCFEGTARVNTLITCEQYRFSLGCSDFDCAALESIAPSSAAKFAPPILAVLTFATLFKNHETQLVKIAWMPRVCWRTFLFC